MEWQLPLTRLPTTAQGDEFFYEPNTPSSKGKMSDGWMDGWLAS